MKRITASSQGHHYCNAIVQKCLYCLKYILLLCRYYCTRRVVVVTSAIALLVAIFCSYYLYLDSLYLIDEILEGDLLRELTMKEKLTIRVLAPYSGLNDLSQFVLFHSICPSVHEIQILWHREESPPSDEYFKYTKTHSKVNFYRFNDMHLMDNMYGNVGVETESKSVQYSSYVVLYGIYHHWLYATIWHVVVPSPPSQACSCWMRMCLSRATTCPWLSAHGALVAMHCWGSSHGYISKAVDADALLIIKFVLLSSSENCLRNIIHACTYPSNCHSFPIRPSIYL